MPLLQRDQIKVSYQLNSFKQEILRMSQLQGWKGIFSHDGGWLAAGKAINAIGEVLKERGIQFGFGG